MDSANRVAEACHLKRIVPKGEDSQKTLRTRPDSQDMHCNFDAARPNPCPRVCTSSRTNRSSRLNRPGDHVCDSCYGSGDWLA